MNSNLMRSFLIQLRCVKIYFPLPNGSSFSSVASVSLLLSNGAFRLSGNEEFSSLFSPPLSSRPRYPVLFPEWTGYYVNAGKTGR